MEIVQTIILRPDFVVNMQYTLRKHYIQTIDMLLQLGENSYIGNMFQIGSANSRNQVTDVNKLGIFSAVWWLQPEI